MKNHGRGKLRLRRSNYYPIPGELHSTAIENLKVAKKVEAAAKAAGFHLTWVKSMDDR
jgi:hypothetical protein